MSNTYIISLKNVNDGKSRKLKMKIMKARKNYYPRWEDVGPHIMLFRIRANLPPLHKEQLLELVPATHQQKTDPELRLVTSARQYQNKTKAFKNLTETKHVVKVSFCERG